MNLGQPQQDIKAAHKGAPLCLQEQQRRNGSGGTLTCNCSLCRTNSRSETAGAQRMPPPPHTHHPSAAHTHKTCVPNVTVLVESQILSAAVQPAAGYDSPALVRTPARTTTWKRRIDFQLSEGDQQSRSVGPLMRQPFPASKQHMLHKKHPCRCSRSHKPNRGSLMRRICTQHT